MTINDGWAKASLRFIGSGIDYNQLNPDLAPYAVAGPRGDVLAFSVGGDVEIDLQQLLKRVEQFSIEHREGLSGFSRRTGASLQLFIGWSPKSPQESVSISEPLLAVLAGLGASIVFDTYSE